VKEYDTAADVMREEARAEALWGKWRHHSDVDDYPDAEELALDAADARRAERARIDALWRSRR
jgi:hypothetical protein